VITPEVRSETVPNPVGDADEVGGVVVGTLEDRADVGNTSEDELGASGWGGAAGWGDASLQAQWELLLDQAAWGAGVLSQWSDEPHRNPHAMEMVTNSLIGGDRPHKGTVDGMRIHGELIDFGEFVVVGVRFELEVKATNDGETEGEFEVCALKPRDGFESDLC
jgi:hypothetical protein